MIHFIYNANARSQDPDWNNFWCSCGLHFDKFEDAEKHLRDTGAHYDMPLVEFVDPVRLISLLDQWGVEVTTLDGVKATGVLYHFIPRDGTETMIQIRETISDELILATDVRNLVKIVVL